MTPNLLERAAAARADGMAARADRPRQRRAAEGATGEYRAAVDAPAQLSLRAPADEGGTLAFTGYASVYERAYEMWDWYGPYTEIVEAGAGEATLARADLDVPLLIQHAGMPLARTTNGSLRLSEDDTGLRTEADLDPADRDVDYIAGKVRAELVNEMSFAFRIEVGQWSPDYSEYRIKRYDIHRGDVAIVRYGANPHTGDPGLMSLLNEDRPTEARGRDLIGEIDFLPLAVRL